MVDVSHVKRKNFRFPAYDDEVGVKLTPEHKRTSFLSEPMLNQPHQAYATSTPNTPPLAPEATAFDTTATANSPVAADDELAGAEKKPLANHLLRKSRVIAPRKNNLFGSMHKQASYHLEQKQHQNEPTKQRESRLSAPMTRSYFVPTYVPASVIPETEPPKITEEELLQSMQKEQHTYLLFDDNVQFQEKKESDPTVKKFNHPTEEPDIPVTRRQYQQIKPDIERFSKEDIRYALPRSRQELKNAKANAKNQTAYGKKLAEATQAQKRGILEKSLDGLIEDSERETENNQYFN